MNLVAPEGQMYACGACGKRSHDRYGLQPIDKGWDESCMLNAVLVYETPERVNAYKAVSFMSTHAEQIDAHVRIEAAKELHDDLVLLTRAERWAALLTRAERWAGMYGMARMMIELGAPSTEAIAELDRYRRRMFPEDFEREVHEGIEPEREWARGSD